MTTTHQRIKGVSKLALALLIGMACHRLFAGAPELRSVLPPVAAPKTVTVTTTIPAVIYVAPVTLWTVGKTGTTGTNVLQAGSRWRIERIQ